MNKRLDARCVCEGHTHTHTQRSTYNIICRVIKVRNELVVSSDCVGETLQTATKRERGVGRVDFEMGFQMRQ